MFNRELITYCIFFCLLQIITLSCNEESSKAEASKLPFFFTLKKPQNEAMQAILSGKLISLEECLLISDYTVIWPEGFTLQVEKGIPTVYNRSQLRVARIGDYIRVSGGEIKGTESLQHSVDGGLVDKCGNLYWIINDIK